MVQYDLMPFQEVTITDVLTSWTIVDNDIIVNIDRNYNKKEFTIKLDSLNKLPKM